MLGDCCDGEQSHVVGFGRKWPTATHHRGSSCKSSDPESCSCTAAANAHTLWGALMGGPTRDDQFSVDGALCCVWGCGCGCACGCLGKGVYTG